jgi:hypothetical protein
MKALVDFPRPFRAAERALDVAQGVLSLAGGVDEVRESPEGRGERPKHGDQDVRGLPPSLQAHP